MSKYKGPDDEGPMDPGMYELEDRRNELASRNRRAAQAEGTQSPQEKWKQKLMMEFRWVVINLLYLVPVGGFLLVLSFLPFASAGGRRTPPAAGGCPEGQTMIPCKCPEPEQVLTEVRDVVVETLARHHEETVQPVVGQVSQRSRWMPEIEVVLFDFSPADFLERLVQPLQLPPGAQWPPGSPLVESPRSSRGGSPGFYTAPTGSEGSQGDEFPGFPPPHLIEDAVRSTMNDLEFRVRELGQALTGPDPGTRTGSPLTMREGSPEPSGRSQSRALWIRPEGCSRAPAPSPVNHRVGVSASYRKVETADVELLNSRLREALAARLEGGHGDFEQAILQLRVPRGWKHVLWTVLRHSLRLRVRLTWQPWNGRRNEI